jgi:hypothetical protein
MLLARVSMRLGAVWPSLSIKMYAVILTFKTTQLTVSVMYCYYRVTP